MSMKEELKKKDPLCEQHPIPGQSNPTYLYNGLMTNSVMAEKVNQFFNKNARPVRIF